MDKLKINFVSQGSSYLASHKMRVQKPVELLNMGVSDIEATITTKVSPEAHMNVFFKHFDKMGNLKGVSSGKYYTMFDVCDDHFSREIHEEYYKLMCNRVDLVTCNTENMKDRILEETGKEALVIPDPITFPEGTKKEVFNKTPTFLWFGHSSNLAPLYEWLEFLPFRVTVVSDNLPQHHQNIDFIPWKPMVVESLIKDYDIVLLPTQDTPWAKCKSPNRAVDALYSGKTVITDNKDIYEDLDTYVYIIEAPKELPELIKEIMSVPLVDGQNDYLKEAYGDAAVLDAWLNAFVKTGMLKGFKEHVE